MVGDYSNIHGRVNNEMEINENLNDEVKNQMVHKSFNH